MYYGVRFRSCRDLPGRATTGPKIKAIDFERYKLFEIVNYLEMKPIITNEELQALKARYNVKRKHDSP